MAGGSYHNTFHKRFATLPKGLLLHSKRGPFAFHKDSFCIPKGLLLQPQRTPSEKRKENALNTHYYIYIYMQTSITSTQTSIYISKQALHLHKQALYIYKTAKAPKKHKTPWGLSLYLRFSVFTWRKLPNVFRVLR